MSESQVYYFISKERLTTYILFCVINAFGQLAAEFDPAVPDR